ncbi:MAG: sulfotransferase family 2 domain-containing protein [Cytophagales bacterium]|nr:sulfotransferase family 2 domain-containing protein [Cytophaga sp.]
MDNTVIISIHNYKTAGVTFHSVIDRQFRSDQILNANLIGIDAARNLIIESSNEFKRNIKIIHGHFPFGWGTFFPQKSTYITFVRNPIERVISDYYYCRKFHLAHNYQYASRMSFKEYLTCGEILNIDNGQTRFISGDLSTPYGMNNQEMLDKAIHNIDTHFSLVGITEKFDESLILANYIFSWNKFYYASKNVTSEKGEVIDEDILELIRSRNQLDIKLYEHALAKHNAAIQQIPFMFARTAFLESSKMLYNTLHPVFKMLKNIMSSSKSE